MLKETLYRRYRDASFYALYVAATATVRIIFGNY